MGCRTPHSHLSSGSTWPNHTKKPFHSTLLPEIRISSCCKFMKASMSKKHYDFLCNANKAGFSGRYSCQVKKEKWSQILISQSVGCKFSCTDSLCSFLFLTTKPSIAQWYIHGFILCRVQHDIPSILHLVCLSLPWRGLIVSSAYPASTSATSFSPKDIWPVSLISRGFRHQDDKSSPLSPWST